MLSFVLLGTAVGLIHLVAHRGNPASTNLTSLPSKPLSAYRSQTRMLESFSTTINSVSPDL